MKPNVLFIIDSFEQGGSERQALQLLRDVHQSGRCRVHLACLQSQGSLRAEAEQLGIGEIHEYALSSFYNLNFLKQLRRLVRFIKENEIDVVHTHCFYTNIFGMAGAFLARVPARITSKGETEGFRTPVQKRAERLSFRLAHRVIANCLVVQDQWFTERSKARDDRREPPQSGERPSDVSACRGASAHGCARRCVRHRWRGRVDAKPAPTCE